MSTYIMELEGVLLPSICQQIINKFEQDRNTYIGETGQGVKSDRKSSVDLDLKDDQGWKEINQILQDSLKKGIKQYIQVNRSFSALKKIRSEGFKIHKYPRNEGFFEWHVDNYNLSVSARVLSCVWYLNSLSEGGETEFMYQKRAVKPEEGKLLLFPPGFEYVHRGMPSNEKDKYIVVTFVEHAPV